MLLAAFACKNWVFSLGSGDRNLSHWDGKLHCAEGAFEWSQLTVLFHHLTPIDESLVSTLRDAVNEIFNLLKRDLVAFCHMITFHVLLSSKLLDINLEYCSCILSRRTCIDDFSDLLLLLLAAFFRLLLLHDLREISGRLGIYDLFLFILWSRLRGSFELSFVENVNLVSWVSKSNEIVPLEMLSSASFAIFLGISNAELNGPLGMIQFATHVLATLDIKADVFWIGSFWRWPKLYS
jgi:hypothetical protein